MNLLLLKLTLVPTLIGLVTLAGRRWGPSVAGWLSAFPVVSGLILVFIALEQGAAFAARSAVGTLSAVLAIIVFGLGYAWAATRRGWFLSLTAGFACYAVAVAGLQAWAPDLASAAVAVAGALVVAPRLYPAMPTPRAAVAAAASDIPLRMAAGALLVLAVTHFAGTMGANLSGVFAMFPVMGSVLVAFSHRQAGAAFAIRLLRGMVLGYYAFGIFCVVLALALPALPMLPAFLYALMAALIVQGASRARLQPQRA
ncbi:MAG TPA: hypothetical protein VFF16_13415 [Telluria sp.]|nr:hypothetical protein [Telluria sp.]